MIMMYSMRMNGCWHNLAWYVWFINSLHDFLQSHPNLLTCTCITGKNSMSYSLRLTYSVLNDIFLCPNILHECWAFPKWSELTRRTPSVPATVWNVSGSRKITQKSYMYMTMLKILTMEWWITLACVQLSVYAEKWLLLDIMLEII